MGCLLYLLLGFLWGKQGSGHRWGTKSCRMGRFSVRPFSLWVIQPSLRPSQLILKPEAGWLAGWLGLRAGWLGLRPGWLGLRPGWLGLRPGWIAQRGDVRTYVQANERKISPFYRTLSPIGA